MAAKAMSCVGLCLLWEKDGEVRQRLREEKKLIVHGVGEEFCQPNRPNSIMNAAVLGPVLQRLSNVDKFKLPHLEDLKVEIYTLYEKCALPTPEQVIYQAAVELKRLVGFISRRVKRKEVTKERVCDKTMFFIFVPTLAISSIVFTCLFFLPVGVRLSLFYASCPCQDRKFHELLLILDPSLKDWCFDYSPKRSTSPQVV